MGHKSASTKSHRALRRAGRLGVLSGVALIASGSAAWFTVTRELRSEAITVSPDADLLPDKPVQGPITAFSQAQTIRRHSLAGSGGKTFAELPEDDPKRETLLVAASLRTSLYTSVLSYGVSALAIGLGVLSLSTGRALRRAGSKHHED